MNDDVAGLQGQPGRDEQSERGGRCGQDLHQLHAAGRKCYCRLCESALSGWDIGV